MIVYSMEGCGKCEYIKARLAQAHIPYYEAWEDVAREKGIVNFPVVEHDGEMMNFSETCKWLREMERGKEG